MTKERKANYHMESANMLRKAIQDYRAEIAKRSIEINEMEKSIESATRVLNGHMSDLRKLVK